MAYTKLEVKNPVLKNGVHYMTSDYKSRNKKRPTHNGIDMIGKFYAKDYIIAIESGTVSSTGYDSGAGYYVNITHANGLVSKYFHMTKGTIVVKKGDTVKKGQTLGYMGSTGNSTGAHLHFGIKKGSNYIDPLPYLKGDANFGNNEESKKSVEDIAKEVIAGKWGNGQDRKDRLTNAGYNYSEVQAKVNELLKGNTGNDKKYIQITANGGVWCRKGVGFKYAKYKVIPKGTKCELLEKNAGTANGYKWDKVKYNGVVVYLPNNWNKYL